MGGVGKIRFLDSLAVVLKTGAGLNLNDMLWGKFSSVNKRAGHIQSAKALVAVFTALSLGLSVVQPVAAATQPAATATERRLAFHMVNTKEKIDIVYKRDGKFLPDALKKLNWLMRDWRRSIPKKMDPAVFDLIWELRSELGSKMPTHVVSGFRTLETNNMLRRIGRHVAKRSQHTQGRAIDLFFPDVPLVKLRDNALVKERGGVGYYPRSSSKGFVHLDTGSVRHWPSISKAQLASIFRKHKKEKKAKAILLASVARKKPARSPVRQITKISAGARSALASKIAAVTAPVPKPKPKAVIAAFKVARLEQARRETAAAIISGHKRLEILARQEDIQIIPASASLLHTNFFIKSDSQIGIRAGLHMDKPFAALSSEAKPAVANVTPGEKNDGFWEQVKSFNFFLLSLFRRNGQPQRFQIAVHNMEQPATGDADVDGFGIARTVPAAVSGLNLKQRRKTPLRQVLTPEQLAHISSQVVNRNSKTSPIRTHAAEMTSPAKRRLQARKVTANVLAGQFSTEAQPLSFD